MSGKRKKISYNQLLIDELEQISEEKPLALPSSTTSTSATSSSSMRKGPDVAFEHDDLNIISSTLLDRHVAPSPLLDEDRVLDHLTTTLETAGLNDAAAVDKEGEFISSAWAKKALKSAQRLQVVIIDAQNLLQSLTPDSTENEIHRVIDVTQRNITYVQAELPKIRHPDAEKEVEKVWQGAGSLQTTLDEWKRAHPDDTSPIPIDNRNAFFTPGDLRSTPTLIAFTIALVVRLFEGAARRGSSVLLKMLKIYGYSLISLGGKPNVMQQKALNDTPESITTVEKTLNLDVPSIPYAVCPECSCHYPPTYPKGSSFPIYPAHCTESLTEHSEPCGAELLRQGKPIKTYHSYSFFEWFGRFIAHPDIEQYGDQFCDDVSSHQAIPDTKRDMKDGSFFHTFRGHDGKLFVSERGEEGRWLFLLHADFFNVEGNRIRGKTSSTGITSLVCLNLPLHMRNDSAWIFIPGLIEGKVEPNAKNSEHRHYWRRLVKEFSEGYTRGLRPHHTYRTHSAGQGVNERVFRFAIAAALMDFKAARPFAGLLDVTSHHYCFMCKCWHKAHLGRTDCENWEATNRDYLKKAAKAWINAKTLKEREQIVTFYGTRYSELWVLPYWDPTTQLLIDAMHTIFLILQQRFFREILGLDNPEASDTKEGKTAKQKSKKKKPFIAFYHDFTPPPHLSEIAPLISESSDILRLEEPETKDQRLSLLDWSDISSEEQAARISRMEQLIGEIEADHKAFQAVGSLHSLISLPIPNSKNEQERLKKKLGKFKWPVLAYVCNDLMEFPDGKEAVRSMARFQQRGRKGITCRQFAEALYHWRAERVVGPDQQFDWPNFKPKDKPSPSIPWINLHDAHENQRMEFIGKPELSDRLQSLAAIKKSLTSRSAYDIGHIHRYLTQPFADGTAKVLRVNLGRMALPALAFVCIDLACFPSGKSGKAQLIEKLVQWRLTKPVKPLERVTIESEIVLQNVQQCVREIILPSWITRPPADVGLKRAGTLKADHWRVLFAVILPLTLISMWGDGSPFAVDNADKMSKVLETSMHLTCASIVMARNSLSPERRELFRSSLKNHLLGLKQIFPGFILPSHHLAFHIYDFMEPFSTVHNWWCFPFENMIGRMQRIPTNHKTGQLESTLLHSFCKGAAFRRWLMRPDCPSLLKFCGDLLDKAYGYDKREEASQNVESESFNVTELMDEKSNQPLPSSILGGKVLLSATLPSKLAKAVGISNPVCYSQVPASKGFYGIPSSVAVGNSYVCYRLNPQDDSWVTGQIQYIFDHEGRTQMGIFRSKPYMGPLDPCSQFVTQGFDARTVSSRFFDRYDIVPIGSIVGHAARWELSADFVAVLSLGRD